MKKRAYQSSEEYFILIHEGSFAETRREKVSIEVARVPTELERLRSLAPAVHEVIKCMISVFTTKKELIRKWKISFLMYRPR